MFYWGYLVPAAVIAVNFQLLWRFVVPPGMSITARRRWFFWCSVVLFMPMDVREEPALLGDLALTILPNGFYFVETLARRGIGHVVYCYVVALPFIAISACITALPVKLIASVFVGRAPIEEHRRWLDAASLIVVAAGTFALAKSTLPLYGISPEVTNSRVELMYGHSMDAVEALEGISDPEARDAEARRLVAQFRADPTIVELFSAHRDAPDTERLFSYENDNEFASHFCTSANHTAQPNLVLCVSSYALSNRRMTASHYRTPSESEPSQIRVVLDLDYNKLLRRL